MYYQNILKEEFYKNQEILIIKDFIRKYQNYEVIDSFEIKIDDLFVNDSIEWYDLWDGERRAHPFRNFEKIINKMYSNIGLGKLLDPQAWVLFSSNPNIYLFQNDKYYLNIKENEDKLTKYKNLSKESIQFILSQFRKQKIKEQSRSYINNNNYSIPIFNYPILNYEKYNNFIESLSSLLNNISIKNINDYASKYGYFKKIVLYYDNNKYRKTKKRSKDLSLNLYLRNVESYSILKIFCDNLFIRNNINSISINNIGFFPSSPSLVFSSPFNFKTVTTPKNTDLEYNKQASDLNFNLNNPVDYTAIKASGLLSYFYNGNNFQQKFLYTNLEPSLLILNLRKEELSKLSTLKFEFRK